MMNKHMRSEHMADTFINKGKYRVNICGHIHYRAIY